MSDFIFIEHKTDEEKRIDEWSRSIGGIIFMDASQKNWTHLCPKFMR